MPFWLEHSKQMAEMVNQYGGCIAKGAMKSLTELEHQRADDGVRGQ